jgi:hypothetical protein
LPRNRGGGGCGGSDETTTIDLHHDVLLAGWFTWKTSFHDLMRKGVTRSAWFPRIDAEREKAGPLVLPSNLDFSPPRRQGRQGGLDVGITLKPAV